MTNETLTLILASLTAFFTLITGALAVAVTIGIFYFRKLASDRQRETEKLIGLQNEVANKIQELEKANESNIVQISKTLDIFKKEYSKISSHIYPAPTTPIPFIPNSYEYSPPRGRGPSVVDLQAQITALLSQIQELQAQLVAPPEERGK